MTEKIIDEGNDAIAEFIGLIPTNAKGCWGTCEYLEANPNSTLSCSVPFTDYLLFHNSWDWLIPTIEKIETLDNGKYEVVIRKTKCFINIFEEGKKGQILLLENYPDSKLIATWKAVVSFLNWYEQEKEKVDDKPLLVNALIL